MELFSILRYYIIVLQNGDWWREVDKLNTVPHPLSFFSFLIKTACKSVIISIKISIEK